MFAAILTSQLDEFLERVKGYVALQHGDKEAAWELDFHVYGQHQISTLPLNKGQPSEIFLIGEALASTQALATSVASLARIAVTVSESHPLMKAVLTAIARSISRSKSDVGKPRIRPRWTDI
jgi:hypothetical protein